MSGSLKYPLSRNFVGLGNPLLDISANVDDSLLKKYDMEPNNAILAEEKHNPLYGELVEQHKAEFIAGGSVQNTLRVAEWIIGVPKVAIFFGCVGQDDYARILEEKATEAGVDVRYQRTDAQPTGTCAVLITGTHRSLCANLAAANCFTLDHLQLPANWKCVEEAKFFYISGFFLTVSPPAAQAVAKHAFEQDKPFLMNLSAPFLSQFYKEPLMAALEYVDIVFGNELEAEAFSKEFNFGTSDLREIALKLCELPKVGNKRKRIAVITHGANPVILAQDGKIEEFAVPPIDRDLIVDTNGAGDAFTGGFVAQFAQGKSYATCIRCGIWAAAQIIVRSGCTFEGKADFKDQA